ncbi:ANTAR domain-containing protein [Arthrobacter sp. NyZ413]|uniref:ANTAR domain-containing protein n=1 Tax=Arthrobacter sp. NyZ413 TaxID=3144669 RepID=UPI003BF80AE8
MNADEHNEDFQRLHRLIAGAGDVKGFLEGIIRYGSTTLSRMTGTWVECAVTLHRRGFSATIAGSSDTVSLHDGIEQALGEGPWREALSTGKPVLLADTDADDRWPELSTSLAGAGVRSVLGVPLDLEEDASAVLSFLAEEAGLFNPDIVSEATVFADMAAQALRLAVRIAAADTLIDDLKSVMENRMAIDVATGIIMQQNSCSRHEAVEMLRKASQNRHRKLRDVAEDILHHRTEVNEPAS